MVLTTCSDLTSTPAHLLTSGNPATYMMQPLRRQLQLHSLPCMQFAHMISHPCVFVISLDKACRQSCKQHTTHLSATAALSALV